jgi:hypothetical protein
MAETKDLGQARARRACPLGGPADETRRRQHEKLFREIGQSIYPGFIMVRIWLPADTYGRLLEALPDWSRAHKALNDATEMHYAVGVRRVSCDLPDALALLRVAERVCPESAPLIRIAIRKAPNTHSTHHDLPPQRPDLPGPARDRRPRLLALRALASLHLLVFSFQALHVVDRVRELLRRLL